ncbi:MAG: acyltransferase [Tatlockia sp.]|jgi:peptidoglycan/LPS O-acetylase OafA/YrhL
MKTSSSTNRFSVEIESLRGVASLLVVLGHFYILTILPQFLQTHSLILQTLIGGFFNPQPAVLLFFTISGLVLGRQLRKERVQDVSTYLAYILRRAFRLLPLMWAAVLFAFALQYAQTNSANMSLLYLNLTLKDISLNLPLWSLKVELVCSLLFPILFWAFITGSKLWNALLFIGLSLLSYVWTQPIFVQFFVFFHAGLLIDYFNGKSQNNSRIANPLFLLFFTLVFMLAPDFGIGPRSWVYGQWQSWVLPEIVACSYLLFFIVHKSHSLVNRFLRLSFVRYLGKISFSVYLFHFPLLLFMLKKFPMAGFYQLAVFSLVYFSLLLCIASATFRWVEMPTNRVGRTLSTWLLERKKPSLGAMEASA